MSDTNLKAVGVSKWYGQVSALLDVSFELTPGIWGLLGPNGSGKTSLLGICSGLLRPSSGRLTLMGQAPFGNPEVLRHIGVCPEADALYPQLSGFEFVKHMARLGGMATDDAEKAAEKALASMSLQDAQHRPLGTYSRGMRQRAKLAQAMVHDPDILLLDEPLSGTDPVSRKQIVDEIRQRAERGAMVVFSSHILAEVEKATDQLLLLVRGRLLAQGKSGDIRGLLDEHPHAIRVNAIGVRKLASALIMSDAIQEVSFVGENEALFHTADPDKAFASVNKLCAAHDDAVNSIESEETSMESLFHYLVARDRIAGGGADAASGKKTKKSAQAKSNHTKEHGA